MGFSSIIKIKSTLFIVLFVTVCLMTAAPASAHGDDDHEGRGGKDEVLEEVSEVLGTLSLWGLIVLNGLYYYGMALKRLPKKTRAELPQNFKTPLRWKVRFRNYHYWGNPVVLGIGFLHGVWAEHQHFVLWMGWGLLVLLTFSGLIMKLQKADAPGAKAHRLIHTQHTLAVLMATLLLVGHALAD